LAVGLTKDPFSDTPPPSHSNLRSESGGRHISVGVRLVGAGFTFSDRPMFPCSPNSVSARLNDVVMPLETSIRRAVCQCEIRPRFLGVLFVEDIRGIHTVGLPRGDFMGGLPVFLAMVSSLSRSAATVQRFPQSTRGDPRDASFDILNYIATDAEHQRHSTLKLVTVCRGGYSDQEKRCSYGGECHSKKDCVFRKDTERRIAEHYQAAEGEPE
jgi:hypothetical protein